LEAETVRVVGADRVEAVQLKDGRMLAADLVVVAVGVRPNVTLAAEAGLAVDRGIVVNDHLETSAPGVFAIGECVEHRGQCYGLVEPGYEQASVLARRLAGEDANYPGSVLATNLKVSGVDVFSAGDFVGAPGTEPIVLHDPASASIASSSSRRTAWSVRCCAAITPMPPGTSISSAPVVR